MCFDENFQYYESSEERYNVEKEILNDVIFAPAESQKINSASSILIVGGGPTGVELAGEIAFDFPDKKITMVHSGSRLLDFIGQKASDKTLHWLKSKKVEVKLEQRVNLDSVSDETKTYQTSGGEIISADCHFLCTGTPLGSAWLMGTMLKDNLDSHGRLMVEENLRVKGQKNIFAIGDITDIPVSANCLSLCYYHPVDHRKY
jgi:NADH dehydrogenase FAD-containing subunit